MLRLNHILIIVLNTLRNRNFKIYLPLITDTLRLLNIIAPSTSNSRIPMPRRMSLPRGTTILLAFMTYPNNIKTHVLSQINTVLLPLNQPPFIPHPSFISPLLQSRHQSHFIDRRQSPGGLHSETKMLVWEVHPTILEGINPLRSIQIRRLGEERRDDLVDQTLLPNRD
jgi:hypothetical protein